LGAKVATAEFLKLYRAREAGGQILIPKHIDAMFSEPMDDAEQDIHWLILKWDARQVMRLESEYFSQRSEFTSISRKLAYRADAAALLRRSELVTSMASIARQLATLRRSTLIPEDRRIYPGMHAPVLVFRDGALVIEPRRYGRNGPDMRGTSARSFSVAREDASSELRAFGSQVPGHSHGVVMLSGFYLGEQTTTHTACETVSRIKRPALVKKTSSAAFLVPCLCMEGSGDLQAAPTFTPISAHAEGDLQRAGYLRCLIDISPESAACWINPATDELHQLEQILAQATTSSYAIAA
jgi:hypothetical protein